MNIFSVISLLGGLAMFLYGMEVMGDGLKQSSGTTLRRVLGRLTQSPLMGVITGTLVTAVIQSSTATIVLTVGLITAGILTLRQAVSIVLGANIGTTVTAQIIRLMDIDSSSNMLLQFFKPDTLAPIAMVIGIVLLMFIKSTETKSAGNIAMGFGVLFTGLLSMTAAVAPLAESAAFAQLMVRFAQMPLLGIIVGLVVTVLVQSSSATVGMLQAMSVTGLVTFNLAYPLIMGMNLGTCVSTAIVCSIGSQKDARRIGIVHIVFNTIGTMLFMIMMSILQRTGAFPDMWGSVVSSGDIANFQTLFNLLTAVALLPFTGKLVDLSYRIIKPDPKVEDRYPELSSLDEKLLISPGLALSQATRAISVMGRAAKENFMLSSRQFTHSYSADATREIDECEEVLDRFADNSDHFLIQLSKHVETTSEDRQLNMLMQTVPSLERIGDYATNLDERARRLLSEKLEFSDSAKRELGILFDAVNEIISITVEAFSNNDNDLARKVEPLEEVIDDMVVLLKDRHSDRLRKGICSVTIGLVFMEILTHLERAADQCSTIAMLMLARENDAIMRNHHAYLHELHSGEQDEYRLEFEARQRQYFVPIEQDDDGKEPDPFALPQ